MSDINPKSGAPIPADSVSRRAVEENSIPYEEAVNELKQLSQNNWRIGEIADRVEPEYGERTLQRLAEESLVEYKTLLNCRAVWRAWPESSLRREDVSWAVHAIFAAQPDRFDLIRRVRWPAHLARREVQRRRRESCGKPSAERGGPPMPPRPTLEEIERAAQEALARRKQQAAMTWLQAVGPGIAAGLARRCAEEPPGSPLNPPTWEPDLIYDFEGEDDSGFEGGSEDDVEADEEDDVPDPWLFTCGNKKVGDRVLLWNLPVFDTCPGKTMSCASNCSANNGNYRRPPVKRRHAWNRQAAEADNFCERAIVELRQRSHREVRIHSAGDFYTPEYVRKWLAIAAALPGVTFWYYTRSWRVPAILPELVRLASLPNVYSWFSCDRDTGLPDAVPNVRACWLQIEDELPPSPAPGQMTIDAESVAFRTKREGREPAKRIGLATVCPTYNGLPAAAGVTCETCRFCFR